MSKEKCLVCNGNNLAPLLFYYSRFLPKLFHRIAICHECGHVQVYPLFRKEELKNINNRFFGIQYMKGNDLNIADNQKKLEKLDQRISSYIKKGMNVLDVGAGEAWAMDYFQNKKCNYSAIEAVPRLADSITDRGG